MPQDQSFRERVDRIGALVDLLEAAADPAVRTTAKDLVSTVMELHGVGLERVIEIVSRSGESSPAIVESLTRDPLVGSLLILHGLHPDDLETRVAKALEKVSGVEITALEGGVLHLSVRHGSEDAARHALSAAAPDLEDVVIEAPGGFVPLSALSLGAMGTRP